MIRRAILTILLVLAVAAPVAAADLDTLRSQGIVAERYDGYVEIRQGGDAQAQALVERVNERRRDLYRERANNQGVSPAQVGKVYAKQILKKMPAGSYFLRPDGSYARK